MTRSQNKSNRTDWVRRTLWAPVKVHNKREHIRLDAIVRQTAWLKNCIAEQDEGIRRHNRRWFERKPCDTEPLEHDFHQVDAEDTHWPAEKLVVYPRKLGLQYQMVAVRKWLREHDAEDRFLELPSDCVRQLCADVARARKGEDGAPKALHMRALSRERSFGCETNNGVSVREEVDSEGRGRPNRRWKVTVKRAGLPVLRATFHQEVRREHVTGWRAVRALKGGARGHASKWELHLSTRETRTPGPKPVRKTPRINTFDFGGRRSSTDAAGRCVRPAHDTAHKAALDTSCARKERGPNQHKRACARRRENAHLEARRGRAQRKKAASVAARECDVAVGERLDWQRSPSKGTAQRGMNRSLDSGAPGHMRESLVGACAKHDAVWTEVPAAWTTRQCTRCGSRDTKVTRSRVRCRRCGAVHDRDHAGACNIPLLFVALWGASSPSGTGRAGSLPHNRWRAPRALATLCGTSPENLRGPRLHTLAMERWGESSGRRERKGVQRISLGG